MTQRKGNWIQTFTGRQFWPMDPRPGDFDIVDIAHALSNTCRFTGHCREFYSVAQHSVLVAQASPPEYQLEGLLHDATEAFICDIARPVKPYLTNYKDVEAVMYEALAIQFGIPARLNTRVKEIDNAILADEADQLMEKPPQPWDFYAEPLGIDIDPWSPSAAKSEFLRAFAMLEDRRSLPYPVFCQKVTP